MVRPSGLVLVALAVLLARSAAVAQGAPQTDCDRLAGLDYAPRAPGIATVFAVRDPAAAIAACETAVARYPSEPFFRLQLSRARIAADRDDPRARTLVEGIANAPAGAVATWLGLFHQYGWGGLPVDPVQAGALFRQACDGAAPPFAAIGCANLGRLILETPGTEPGDQAIALLQRACDAGLARGCQALGYEYEQGLRVRRDLPRALALYRQACAAGDPMACNNYASRQATGDGVPQDRAAAVATYERVCAQGLWLGCENLAEAYRTGTGVPADPARAAAVLDRACASGDGDACQRADALR